jgi:hypothetical protein
VNVTVTLRIDVLADPPRAGLVDLTLTCAVAGAAITAATTAATAAGASTRWMLRIGSCSPSIGLYVSA